MAILAESIVGLQRCGDKIYLNFKKGYAMKRLIMILVASLFLFGCGGGMQIVSDEFIEFAKSDVETVQKLIAASEALKITWPFYSGCIDAMTERLSGKAIEQKNKLDVLYANGEWNDRMAGETLVLRSFLMAEMSIEEIDKLLPGFRKLLSPLF